MEQKLHARLTLTGAGEMMGVAAHRLVDVEGDARVMGRRPGRPAVLGTTPAAPFDGTHKTKTLALVAPAGNTMDRNSLRSPKTYRSGASAGP